MREEGRRLETYVVEAFCDKCNGPLNFTGRTLLSNPEQYVHKCDNCGVEENLPYIFPRIEYREIGGNN